MSSHATAERLSAYLDRQLVEPQARQLEEHLESCSRCHVRLEGMRQVVSSLSSLEPLSTPPDFKQAVARRIALATDRPSLADRFEEGVSIFNRQSPILSMFAVVIALALFIFFYSVVLQQRENAANIPVIFMDPPQATGAVEEGALLILGDLELRWRGGEWVQAGVSTEAVSRTIKADSEEGRELLAARPELAGLADRSAVIEVEGEVVRLE